MFTVILPTYKRPELILRSIKSVQAQTCPDWELLVVIDDPISDYSETKNTAQSDSRITIIENTENLGKNASVNKALSILESKNYTGHIIFLDDDDWLAPSCLSDFSKVIESAWVVSERQDVTTNKSLTHSVVDSSKINYLTDMLLFRRFQGETTHCIYFPPVAHIRFPSLIKNAEEWLYFASVAEAVGSFFYLPSTGTVSEGYLADGLSVSKKSRREKILTLSLLLREVWQRKFASLSIYLYLAGRTLKTLVIG
jgi:glycosyltransferase involved in cell wall biosynthesis